ncbi:MAG: universal stress protein [Bacteroidota bacterium]
MKKLERSLSLPSVVAIGIGGMLGSGIFVLPGIAAAKTGPSIWLAYLLAGLCVLPAALSKSELATAMPTSGGTYVYIERAFGPAMGTISGIGLWLSLLLKSSFALVGFGAYLLVFAPQLPLKVVALVSLGLILLLNILGVKKVGKAQLVIVSISLVGLAGLIVGGVFKVDPNNLQPAFLNGNYGLYAATAFVFVSYAGVTKVAAIAEEIKNPGRNLPIAMLLALVLVTGLYATISFAMVGTIPIEELSNDLSPVHTMANSLFGKTAGIAAAVLGVITLISMANSGVLAASRFPFAMSRDKLAPEQLGKVHQRFLTPVLAIIITCGLMALVITFLEVEKIAKLASGFKVMMFILVNMCVIVLRETSVAWYQPKYRSPLYPWIQIFGILSGIGLLIVLGFSALLSAIGIIIAGLGTFYLYGKSRVQRKGVLRVYGHRPAAFLLYKRQQAEKAAAQHDLVKEDNHNLDGALADDAKAVTPLFGQERSPEMLVEMAAALADGDKIQVVHIREVPDQTRLADMVEDDPLVHSLNRRIGIMADARKVDVDFDAAVTHDLVETVQEISEQTHCQWMVASWNGRQMGARLIVRNPIGWLVTHIDSNFALFLDNGVRYIRRIVVAIRPGRQNPAFIQACDRIAQFYGAELTLMRVVSKDMDEAAIASIRDESTSLLEPCLSPASLRIEKDNDPVHALSEASAEFDLLVIGTPDKENWLDVLLGANKDRFAKNAACSVLRLTFK